MNWVYTRFSFLVCPLVITPGVITSGHYEATVTMNTYIYICTYFAYTLYNAEFRQESDFEVKHIGATSGLF